ncbi:uncharacterized protein LOC120110132 isoform X2 [Phoenix dactylifera]|uniref:Uncharacterized protein LOC120110132 isoform X2 n=1 Tax=Phoenix dactylifera TaxID=42345 RepID=A0A8B9A7Z1_PHODC|nr:uncharacterized protein LOC120110132 isoform X2 [Phoenix dactylifera]
MITIDMHLNRTSVTTSHPGMQLDHDCHARKLFSSTLLEPMMSLQVKVPMRLEDQAQCICCVYMITQHMALFEISSSSQAWAAEFSMSPSACHPPRRINQMDFSSSCKDL